MKHWNQKAKRKAKTWIGPNAFTGLKRYQIFFIRTEQSWKRRGCSSELNGKSLSIHCRRVKGSLGALNPSLLLSDFSFLYILEKKFNETIILIWNNFRWTSSIKECSSVINGSKNIKCCEFYVKQGINQG